MKEAEADRANRLTASEGVVIYDQRLPLYREFAQRLANLLEILLQVQPDVRLNQVTSRVKTRESVKQKLDRKVYQSIDEITDLAGVRIITYFDDDVDVVARMIESEFTIDSVNSVDKRSLLDPDRFGYRSLHFVVSLSHTRDALPEFTRFRGLKAEVQVRSILQHAWAEIEHDLGYKSNEALPADIKRQFFRLASLLELADSEFRSIRDGIQKYESTLSERLLHDAGSVHLDAIALRRFLLQNPVVADLQRELQAMAGDGQLEDVNDETMELWVRALRELGITTAEELECGLLNFRSFILQFASEWTRDSPYVTTGSCVVYLLYVATLLMGDGLPQMQCSTRSLHTQTRTSLRVGW